MSRTPRFCCRPHHPRTPPHRNRPHSPRPLTTLIPLFFLSPHPHRNMNQNPRLSPCERINWLYPSTILVPAPHTTPLTIFPCIYTVFHSPYYTPLSLRLRPQLPETIPPRRLAETRSRDISSQPVPRGVLAPQTVRPHLPLTYTHRFRTDHFCSGSLPS